MPLLQRTLTFSTSGRGLLDITRPVAEVVDASGVRTGLCTVFCRHTSASLLITENASPDARRDLLAWLARLARGDAQTIGRRRPSTRATTKAIRKTKNRIVAMSVARPATPHIPKMPAMSAMTRKEKAQVSMCVSPLSRGGAATRPRPSSSKALAASVRGVRVSSAPPPQERSMPVRGPRIYNAP